MSTTGVSAELENVKIQRSFLMTCLDMSSGGENEIRLLKNNHHNSTLDQMQSCFMSFSRYQPVTLPKEGSLTLPPASPKPATGRL